MSAKRPTTGGARHPDLDDGEAPKIGRDAFPAAHGLVAESGIIAAREGAEPFRGMGSRHLPDACGLRGVRWTAGHESLT